ncbi:MAG: hypothetical protein ABIQ39_13290, partial [Ilumatobacteraceae bacterium]
GQYSFRVEVTNCGFDGMGTAAIDMQGVANTTLTVQNNAAHASTIMVRAINGPGSSLVNEGGSYVSTGTTLGYTAAGSDDTAQANPGFVGNSVAKPPSGSSMYSGGTALNITAIDRLGQTFKSPWAQGPYAQYSISDGETGTTPPDGGGTGIASVWESYYTPAGEIAYLAEQGSGSSITGIVGVPARITLVVGETYTLAPRVTGLGEFSGIVTYSVVGASASVTAQGAVKGLAVGESVVTVASAQRPTIFLTTYVTVTNFSEYPITAVPQTLALNMIDGPKAVTIFSNGKTQAGLSALSTNSLVVASDERTSFGGILNIRPVSIGTAIVLVTKQSRAGGQLTIEIPVTVTAGTAAGDVTRIETAGDHIIFINQTPYFIPLTDQNGDPILGCTHVVSVKISLPGYIAAPHTVIDGTLPVYPVGVGIATLDLELHDPVAGAVKKRFTVEVLPIGGTSAGAPPPPPPISPTNPDPSTIDGDYIFEVVGGGTAVPTVMSDIIDASGAANTVAENAANGVSVGIMALAVHPGYMITYTLTDDAGGRFAINAVTGIPTKAGALDYATSTSHDITVQAASSDGVSIKTKVFTIAVTAAGAPPADLYFNPDVFNPDYFGAMTGN